MENSPASGRASLGQRLRTQRIAQHRDIEDVARQLRLSSAIVEAMEHDNHERLGAAVFARGRVGGYAQLLGIPMSEVDAQFAQALAVPPPLVGSARRSRSRKALRWFAGKGLHVAIAVAVGLPMISMAAMHRPRPISAALAVLDGDGRVANRKGDVQPVGIQASATSAGASPGGKKPSLISLETTGNGAVASGIASGTLQLRFSGDNWVDIVGPDGRVIDHGAVEAGSVRNYRTTAIARVAIGDSGSVLVLRDGEPVDLAPFRGANETRFALSSSGQPTPVRD